ncbi:hypothetical protein AB6D11_06430 [Vibrio splendidus]
MMIQRIWILLLALLMITGCGQDSPETIKAKNARFIALVDEAATEQVALRQQQLNVLRLPYEAALSEKLNSTIELVFLTTSMDMDSSPGGMAFLYEGTLYWFESLTELTPHAFKHVLHRSGDDWSRLATQTSKVTQEELDSMLGTINKKRHENAVASINADFDLKQTIIDQVESEWH